jgi:TonB family protein
MILAALLGLTILPGPSELGAGEIVHPVLHETPPILVHRVEPRCDPACVGGPMVALTGIVSAEGRVAKIRVRKAGTKAFTAACVRAFAQWRYRPAQAADGHSIPVSITVTFEPPPPAPA